MEKIYYTSLEIEKAFEKHISDFNKSNNWNFLWVIGIEKYQSDLSETKKSIEEKIKFNAENVNSLFLILSDSTQIQEVYNRLITPWGCTPFDVNANIVDGSAYYVFAYRKKDDYSHSS